MVDGKQTQASPGDSGSAANTPCSGRSKLFGCDMAILDDGFQHMQLHRDLDIVLLNGTEDRMFPLGSLREPLSALRRADVLCFSGKGELPGSRYLKDRPVFRHRVAAVRLQIGSDPSAFHDPGPGIRRGSPGVGDSQSSSISLDRRRTRLESRSAHDLPRSPRLFRRGVAGHP